MKRMGPKVQGVFDWLAVTIFSLSLIGVGVNFLAGCAGWGKTTCQVVDAAAGACTVLRFMGDDGKVHEVPISPKEASEFGKSLAAKKK